MIAEPKSDIERRARRLVRRWRHSTVIEASVDDDVSYAGGGSLPMNAIPTAVVKLQARGIAVEELARRLRRSTPAVIARIKEGQLLLDLRTVAAREHKELSAAIEQAVQ
jgi:L-seryl-tRNA(Ser) seleniumtransferase